jgi:hypothetical protein
LIAQHETLLAVEEYGLADYTFEPQSFSGDTRPDAVWYVNPLLDWQHNVKKKAHQCFLEIELSAKSLMDGDMDRFFLKLISRKTLVVFRDHVLFDRYLRHAREYAQRGIPDWRNLQGDWTKFDGFILVKPETWNEVIFKVHKQTNPITLTDLL